MTHVVFSSESKTFLAKPQQEKAGIYKAKNEKKNTSHANHYFTHFSKFSHFLCRLFLWIPQPKHICLLWFSKPYCFQTWGNFPATHWGYGYATAFVPYWNHPICRLSRKHRTTCSSDISHVCPGGRQPSDRHHSHLRLTEYASSHAIGMHSVLLSIPYLPSRWRRGRTLQECIDTEVMLFIWKTCLEYVYMLWSSFVSLETWANASSGWQAGARHWLNPCKTWHFSTFPPPWRSRLLLQPVTSWLLYRPGDICCFNPY